MRPEEEILLRAEKLAQIGELWQFKTQALCRTEKSSRKEQFVLNLTSQSSSAAIGIAPPCCPLISLRDYRTAMPLPEFAIIIPACDEAACIGAVLDEFLATVDPEKYVIAVGVNGSSDATARIARQRPVLVAETARRGYGHGCQAAIDLTNNLFPAIRAYVFCAGDGATDPHDLRPLRTAFEQGYDLVLGQPHATLAQLAHDDFATSRRQRRARSLVRRARRAAL